MIVSPLNEECLSGSEAETVIIEQTNGALPSLLELSARSVMKNQLHVCRSELPERMLSYLVSMRGSSCHLCDTVMLKEYHSTIVTEDCIGFPNVAKCIRLCSPQCMRRSVLTAKKTKKSKLQTYLDWQRRVADQAESMSW